MERQHFVVLIDPVGRGRKTKHPSTGDESAACRRRARETVGRREKDRRVRRKWDECRWYGASERDAGKRESGIEGTGRESRDPHPADSYNFNHQLATLLPPRGRVICEKHVDLRVEEGWLYSFISSYISCKRLSLLLRRCSTYMLVEEKGRARYIHALNFIDPRNMTLHTSVVNCFVLMKSFQQCFLKWKRLKEDYGNYY